MKPLRILFYTSWFRPMIKRDMGVELIKALQKGPHTLVGVVGPDEDVLSRAAEKAGVPYFRILKEFWLPSGKLKKALQTDDDLIKRYQDWEAPLRALNIDLGVLYFSTWIPDSMIALASRGFINYHPAPLPQLRGFLPEDFAQLWGWKTMTGTVHKVTSVIDEGPILARSGKARLSLWDTPDTVMQKVGEKVWPPLKRAIRKMAEGKDSGEPQTHLPGFDSGYQSFYPESFLNWEKDSHEMLTRRFQVFRGQAHRVWLKAQVGPQVWEVRDMDLFPGQFPGRPGEVIGHWENHPLVRTTQGACLLHGLKPFYPEKKLNDYLDGPSEDLIAPGPRRNKFSRKDVKKAIE